MPVTLNKIANNTAEVTMSVAGDTLTVTYYPSHVTEKTFAQLQEFASSDENNIIAGFGTLNDVLSLLIKSWDLFEDDQQTSMYPIVPDRLAELPVAFRLQVLSSIMSDIRPNLAAPQTLN